MSAFRIVAPCLLVTAGIIAYVFWPAAPPDAPVNPVLAESHMRQIWLEREKSSAAGLLGSSLVPATYDTGEPPAFPFVTAPKPSAGTQ